MAVWPFEIKNEGQNCSQDTQCNNYELKNINIQIQKSKINAIIGQVGSGKSMFFQAILGEISFVDENFINMD